MMSRLCTGKIVLFVSLLLASPGFSAGSEIIYEQCYIIKSNGAKIGFECDTQRKTAQGIVTEKHIEQRFKRQGDSVEIAQDQSFTEDEKGNPIEFAFSSNDSGESVGIKGKLDFNKGKIFINSNVNGINDSKTLDIEGRMLFPYAVEKLYRETKGKDLEYTSIEPGINSQILVIKSKQVEKGKYKIDLNIFPNADLYEWRDVNGRLTKAYTSIMDMEQLAATKKEIMDVKDNYELFENNVIRVKKNINDPESFKEVMYKITAHDIPVSGIFPDDTTQKTTQVLGNTIFIKVRAENTERVDCPYPFDARGFEEYLKSGPYIITNSEKIKQVATELKAGEFDAVAIAKKADRWVYNNITNKNLSINFANAVKVIETSSGDCTEHSILLASLLRTMGIPAKVVVGLVYTNTPEPEFSYHMWVQAYLGQWVNFDPSFPSPVFSPFHLAMAESPLNDITGKTDLELGIVKNFSKIDIEILTAAKPVVTDVKDRPELKISLSAQDYVNNENFVNVSLDSDLVPVNSQTNKIILPESDEPHDYLKTAFYSFVKGDTEKAYNELKEYNNTIEPDDDFAKMKLALKLINMSYFDFASEVLNSIKDKDIWGRMINELYKLYFPGNFLGKELEEKQAKAFYLLTYKKDPTAVIDLLKDPQGNDYIYYLRAKAFKELKKYPESEYEISLAMRISPETLNYWLEDINIFSAENKIYEAEMTLNNLDVKAKSADIKDKEFWNTFKTYNYWLKVKEFSSDPKLSAYNKAYYDTMKGEYDSALETLNALLPRSQDPYTYELAGEVSYDVENYETARKYYTKALNLDPNMQKSYIALGNIYFITGDNKKAREYYENALKKFPNNIDALVALVKLNVYLGNYTKTYEYAKKALALDKNNPDVLYNLGVILAKNKKLDEAENLFKKALSVDPMQSLTWFELAKVELAKQNYSQAEKYLKNVYYIDENNPYYYYFMGIICNRTNKKEEAKNYFKKAFYLKPAIVDELSKQSSSGKEK